MTANGRPGRLVAVSQGDGSVDLFARGRDDQLLHVREDFFGWSGEELGGRLVGDPSAAVTSTQALHVFARTHGGHLLHWRWEPSSGENGAMVGPIDHDWRIAYDPVAVAGQGGSLFVYARGARDELLRWGSRDGETWEDLHEMGGVARSTPALVQRRQQRTPEAFALGEQDHLTWWTTKRADPTTLDEVEVHREVSVHNFNPPRSDTLTGAPLAVSWAPARIDVLAPGPALADGGLPTLHHWGKLKNDDNRDWLGPDISPLGDVVTLGSIVTTSADHAELFALDTKRRLVRWFWEGGFFPEPSPGWFGPETVLDQAHSQPAAIVRGAGTTHVYAWVGEGATLAEITRVGDAWQSEELEIAWAVGDEQGTQLELPVDVDVLLSRPADLLRLGVSWSGFQLTAGDPPTLSPAPDQGPTLLRLVLPPQHVGEQASPQGGPHAPPVGSGDGGQWQSVRSGPSQLVFDMPAQAVPLTTEGLLAAVRGGTLRGRDSATGELHTFIELPWQLFVAADGATVTHPSSAPPDDGSAVALWRSRVDSEDRSLDIRRAGTADEFDLPLTASDRQTLAAQSSAATFERLELSGLGGTLSAHGSWDGVVWEHDATLGRDQRVRVVRSGLLYPYGHRAELVETTERLLTTPGEAVAVLSKSTVLTVTEPTRRRPTDDELARAFPFDDVTITTRVFEDVTGTWTNGTRPAATPAALLAAVQALEEELASLPVAVDFWTGVVPPDEAVVGLVDEATSSSILGKQAILARRRINLIEDIHEKRELADAARDAASPPVPQFLSPRSGSTWLEFPVTATVGGQAVSFVTPMLFVVDERLPATDLLPAFDTLVDGDVQNLLVREWLTMRSGRPVEPPTAGAEVVRDDEYAGTVRLSGQSLDLVGAGVGDDRQLVNRIYVSAHAVGRDFRARLGPSGSLPEDLTQPAWGLDLTLPSLRGLLPGRTDAHRVVTNLAPEYLVSGPVAEVVHDVVGPAVGRLAEIGDTLVLVGTDGKPLADAVGVVVDFTKDADRSGGLVSPKVVADGLSRIAGPVNVAGLTQLDPAKLLDEGATLLGFKLSSLLGHLDRSTLPTITTDMSGPQPVVTMSWPPVPPGTPPDQKPTQPLEVHSPFGPVNPAQPDNPQPSMSLEVRTSGADVRTECTVRDFSLSFPTDSPLLVLTFGSLRYVQEAGRSPRLEVHGLKVDFTDKLDLLKVLQDKIGLGDKGPTIKVDEAGIVAAYSLAVPEASSGAFVMRNLAFSTAVTVPFQGDPVSVELAFASKAAPFALSVMMFGGGGYVDIAMDYKGLQRMDIALEFGAATSVNFVLAKGEAHVLGGIHFELLPDTSVQLVGYLRVGGSLEILGLVTLTIELVLSLGYQSNGNRLVGRATLVIELDLTIYSDSIELDSGEWVIAGGDPVGGHDLPAELAPGPDPYLVLLREQRAAYQPVEA